MGIETDTTIVSNELEPFTITRIEVEQPKCGQQLITGSTSRLGRLALLAPPTDFFRRPGALHRIKVPMKIWVGAKDTITPPAQSRFLVDVLAAQASVAVQVDPDAGHFTYMDELPPNVPEPHPDRVTFLAGLADEITAFLVA